MISNKAILKTLTLTSSLVMVTGFLFYRIGWISLSPLRPMDANEVSIALLDTTKSEKTKSTPALLPSSKVIIIPKPDSSVQSKARQTVAAKKDSGKTRLSSSKSAIIVDQSILEQVLRKDSSKLRPTPTKPRRKNNN